MEDDEPETHIQGTRLVLVDELFPSVVLTHFSVQENQTSPPRTENETRMFPLLDDALN
jgi:hypothetical protein